MTSRNQINCGGDKCKGGEFTITVGPYEYKPPLKYWYKYWANSKRRHIREKHKADRARYDAVKEVARQDAIAEALDRLAWECPNKACACWEVTVQAEHTDTYHQTGNFAGMPNSGGRRQQIVSSEFKFAVTVPDAKCTPAISVDDPELEEEESGLKDARDVRANSRGMPVAHLAPGATRGSFVRVASGTHSAFLFPEPFGLAPSRWMKTGWRAGFEDEVRWSRE